MESISKTVAGERTSFSTNSFGSGLLNHKVSANCCKIMMIFYSSDNHLGCLRTPYPSSLDYRWHALIVLRPLMILNLIKKLKVTAT